MIFCVNLGDKVNLRLISYKQIYEGFRSSSRTDTTSTLWLTVTRLDK